MLFVHNSCSERQNPRTWKNSTTSTSYYRRLATLNCKHFVLKAGPALSPRDEKILLEPLPNLSCSAQPIRSAPTASQIQKLTPTCRQHRLVLFQSTDYQVHQLGCECLEGVDYSRRTVCHPLDCPPHILLCQPGELNQWLCKFALEIRRKDGQQYPPQTLYSICCGLLRYVRD